MHFYFRPAFVTVRLQSRTDSPQFLLRRARFFTKVVTVRIRRRANLIKSNLTGAEMNLCRLPEVPFALFARSSYGRLFRFRAPGFGLGTSDPG